MAAQSPAAPSATDVHTDAVITLATPPTRVGREYIIDGGIMFCGCCHDDRMIYDPTADSITCFDCNDDFNVVLDTLKTPKHHDHDNYPGELNKVMKLYTYIQEAISKELSLMAKQKSITGASVKKLVPDIPRDMPVLDAEQLEYGAILPAPAETIRVIHAWIREHEAANWSRHLGDLESKIEIVPNISTGTNTRIEFLYSRVILTPPANAIGAPVRRNIYLPYAVAPKMDAIQHAETKEEDVVPITTTQSTASAESETVTATTETATPRRPYGEGASLFSSSSTSFHGGVAEIVGIKFGTFPNVTNVATKEPSRQDCRSINQTSPRSVNTGATIPSTTNGCVGHQVRVPFFEPPVVMSNVVMSNKTEATITDDKKIALVSEFVGMKDSLLGSNAIDMLTNHPTDSSVAMSASYRSSKLGCRINASLWTNRGEVAVVGHFSGCPASKTGKIYTICPQMPLSTATTMHFFEKINAARLHATGLWVRRAIIKTVKEFYPGNKPFAELMINHIPMRPNRDQVIAFIVGWTTLDKAQIERNIDKL